jgi:hypothetical protein
LGIFFLKKNASRQYCDRIFPFYFYFSHFGENLHQFLFIFWADTCPTLNKKLDPKQFIKVIFKVHNHGSQKPKHRIYKPQASDIYQHFLL